MPYSVHLLGKQFDSGCENGEALFSLLITNGKNLREDQLYHGRMNHMPSVDSGKVPQNLSTSVAGSRLVSVRNDVRLVISGEVGY